MNTVETRIAVFDVDRTILLRTSGEIQLIRYLMQHKMLPLINFLRGIIWMIKQLPFCFKEAVLRNKFYLHGLDVKEIHSRLPEFYETCLKPNLSHRAILFMENLKKKGYEIILISGTLDFIVDLLVERLDASGGLGSCMEVVNGKYTGRISGHHPYFHEKVKALYAYLQGRKVNFKNSFGFADSWADVPLLSLFGNPIAINPGKVLRWKAKARGWRTVWD